jgi:hypothetical protein
MEWLEWLRETTEIPCPSRDTNQSPPSCSQNRYHMRLNASSQPVILQTVPSWPCKQTNKQTPLLQSASELYQQSDCRLSTKLMPTFADRGCRVVSATDPYGRNLGFLERSRYFIFQVAPELYSRSWVDPVPDLLLLRTFGSPGNRTRTSGSAARNSDHCCRLMWRFVLGPALLFPGTNGNHFHRYFHKHFLFFQRLT